MSRQFKRPTSLNECLEHCRAAGAAGLFILASDAHTRLKADGLTTADVRHVLENANHCANDGGEMVVVHGIALDGAIVILRIVFDDDGLVVL